MIEMNDVSSFLYTDLNQQINVSDLIFINFFVTENYFSWSYFFPDSFIYIFLLISLAEFFSFLFRDNRASLKYVTR